MGLTPHGPGFAFLDAFEVIERGRRGHGRVWLDPQRSFFKDHFPQEPLMPGVLLIECGAQAAGALWASLAQPGTPARFSLAQVLQFKLAAPVRPGAMVETDVVLEQMLGPLAQFGVTLSVAGTEVARGRLVLGAAKR
jgi:3-hydroxyacyl-[acyl-carrier-protein] dehydratase